jgi:RNA polymerase sigma factor (sigma-70 family)
MPDQPTVTALVELARAGDNPAWEALVERFAPLVWSICRRFRLADADAEDVGQSVWLRLVEHLAVIEEPAALPGWLATTTYRLCLNVVTRRQRADRAALAEAEARSAQEMVPAEEVVLAAERNHAVREAFGQISVRCQELLSLLAQDPPLSYAEIGARLNTAVGGLGPRRARCLQELRRCPVLAALIEADQRGSQGGEKA